MYTKCTVARKRPRYYTNYCLLAIISALRAQEEDLSRLHIVSYNNMTGAFTLQCITVQFRASGSRAIAPL